MVGISFGDFDGKITASSDAGSNYSVKGCKLNQIGKNGHASAWCASGNDKENPWIQVDLGSQYWINAVSLQGRGDSAQWVTQFRIRYSLTDENHLRNAESAYVEMAKLYNFETIKCGVGATPRTVEEIHKDVTSAVRKRM